MFSDTLENVGKGALASTATKRRNGDAKTIQIDQDVYNYLLSKASPAGELPALTLRRELRQPQPTETIEVDDDTYSYLLSKTTDFKESATDMLRRELNLGEVPPPPSPSAIVFRIPAGTGNQPWNTRKHAIVATVGNTLRIVNDDTVPHKLHTTGIPFPHQNTDILPGQAADFVLQAPFDPGGANPCTIITRGQTLISGSRCNCLSNKE